MPDVVTPFCNHVVRLKQNIDLLVKASLSYLYSAGAFSVQFYWGTKLMLAHPISATLHGSLVLQRLHFTGSQHRMIGNSNPDICSTEI